jgi:hypothetical protein
MTSQRRRPFRSGLTRNHGQRRPAPPPQQPADSTAYLRRTTAGPRARLCGRSETGLNGLEAVPTGRRPRCCTRKTRRRRRVFLLLYESSGRTIRGRTMPGAAVFHLRHRRAKVGISGHLYFRTYRTSCRCHSAPAWNCRTRWLRGFQRGRRVAVAEEGGRAGGG